MNLEDLAKKAINEVSTEISKKDDENEVKNKETEQVSVESEEEVEIPLHAEVIDFTDPHKKPPQPGQDTNHILSANEELFLKNVKERVLVLFEGLKAAEYEDIETRLDLTINFLEFLLASIEDKLKK